MDCQIGKFQTTFLKMNHHIDAGEWPTSDQKSLLRFRPGIPFAILTQPSLPEPKRAALLTPSLRIGDFVELFQNMFLRMNRQIDAGEFLSFEQKDVHDGLGRAFPVPC
jgi:hypothetical protein